MYNIEVMSVCSCIISQPTQWISIKFGTAVYTKSYGQILLWSYVTLPLHEAETQLHHSFLKQLNINLIKLYNFHLKQIR